MRIDLNSKKVIKAVLAFLLVVAVFFAGFLTSRYTTLGQPAAQANSGYQLTGDIKTQQNDVNVNLLWEVWNDIDTQYLVQNLDGQKLLYGSVKGLVAALDDPYTNFLTPSETTSYKQSNVSEVFEGIGTTLRDDSGLVVIESPVDGTPAQKAGLLPGDIILKVDGNDLKGKTSYDAANLIRGTAGTQVVLIVHRPSTNKDLTFTITREKIDIPNVSFQDDGNGIVTIKIYKFTEADVQTFDSLWDKAVDQALAANAKYVIVDLRNNPGGYVNAVRYVLGEFLPKGTLAMSEQDRTGNKQDFVVDRTGKMLNLPVAVLVNSGSASASEIFAGAMQDHGRAKIIGETTVGKGVEQEVLTLPDGSTLLLVFQKWLTPNGRNINSKQPITPDILESDATKQVEKAKDILLQSK